ncbi:MAG: oligosaccharide flippase family protein [Armatimonadetes bacterium]|nr:oligosaccharide flippase family protein [Armatimonadota bacterium]
MRSSESEVVPLREEHTENGPGSEAAAASPARKGRFRLPSFRSLMDFGIVLGGTAFATATGFILKVFIGRHLGPDALGVFALCYAVFTVMSIVADVGIRFSMVNLGARCVQDRAERVGEFVAAGLLVKLAAGATVLLLGWLLAPLVASTVFHKPELSPFLQITSVGIFLWSLWDGLEGALHIRQRFSGASALRILMDAGRLAAFFALFFYRDGLLLTMDRFMWLYFLCPGLSVAVGALVVWAVLRPAAADLAAHTRELVVFSRGIFFYRSCTMLLLFMDSLMLTRYGALEQVGQFEAAKGLAYALLLVSESLGMVLLPKVNQLQSLPELKDMLRRMMAYLAILSVAAVVWLSFAGHFLVFFGPKFTLPQVVSTFQILVVATLFTIPSTIMGTVLMSLHKPGVLGRIAALQVVLGLLVYPFSCTYAGIMGAAITGVSLQFVGALSMAVVLRSEVSGKESHPAMERDAEH